MVCAKCIGHVAALDMRFSPLVCLKAEAEQLIGWSMMLRGLGHEGLDARPAWPNTLIASLERSGYWHME